MTVIVYAYQIQENVGALRGFASSVEEVLHDIACVRREIGADDEGPLGPSAVWAFDVTSPELEHLISVLNGEVELRDIILSGKRLVRLVDD